MKLEFNLADRYINNFLLSRSQAGIYLISIFLIITNLIRLPQYTPHTIALVVTVLIGTFLYIRYLDKYASLEITAESIIYCVNGVTVFKENFNDIVSFKLSKARNVQSLKITGKSKLCLHSIYFPDQFNEVADLLKHNIQLKTSN